jgi:hypothetical protein
MDFLLALLLQLNSQNITVKQPDNISVMQTVSGGRCYEWNGELSQNIKLLEFEAEKDQIIRSNKAQVYYSLRTPLNPINVTDKDIIGEDAFHVNEAKKQLYFVAPATGKYYVVTTPTEKSNYNFNVCVF